MKNIEETVRSNILLEIEGLKNVPKVILGLSGGPDSIFLFHILKKLHHEKKITLICAHFNHKWRKCSDKEEVFCKQLAEKEDIFFQTSNPDKLDAQIKFNGSAEELGRKMRQTFFEKIYKKHEANMIMLAHHQDDQVETFFIRLARGSSLQGLCSIKKKSGFYFRPMLEISKNQILCFLEKNNLKFAQDPTNLENSYLRNKIRNILIPTLEKIEPRFKNKILDTILQLKNDFKIIDKASQENFEKIFYKNDKSWTGNTGLFNKLDHSLKVKVFMILLKNEKIKYSPSTALFSEIFKFLKTQNGGCHTINSWKVVKKSSKFWLEKLEI